jgi:hypothetical protein
VLIVIPGDYARPLDIPDDRFEYEVGRTRTLPDGTTPPGQPLWRAITRLRGPGLISEGTGDRPRSAKEAALAGLCRKIASYQPPRVRTAEERRAAYVVSVRREKAKYEREGNTADVEACDREIALAEGQG